MSGIGNEELLRLALESGIIDINTVIGEMAMKKKEDVLKHHKYKLYYGSDGYWHTYIIREDGKRKEIKKKTKEKVLDVLIDFYKETVEELESPLTFKNRWKDLEERQKLCGRANSTIVRYRSEYRRLFSGSRIEKLLVTEITDADIMEHFLVIAKDSYWRTLKQNFDFVKNVFEKAVRDKIISDNPCKYVDILVCKAKCKPDIKLSAEERTFSAEELEILKQRLREVKDDFFVAAKGVELAIYTGMRVGELCGLAWEDVHFGEGYILINKSEKRDHLEKKYYISDTKNHKPRKFPITENIKTVLKELQEYQVKKGYCNEFVLYDANGKVHANKVEIVINRITKKEGFVNQKSIHDLRRTLNSNMKRKGLTSYQTSLLIGNTVEVNEANYTYDVLSVDEKRNILESILSI